MERLTVDYGEKFKPFRYTMKDGSDAEVGYFKNYDAFYSHMMMVQKLGEYEDLEEQGLLVKLPCKVGDTVYSVTRNFISEYMVCSIEKYNEGLFFNWRCEKGIYINVRGFTNYDIGNTVFLTKEEAEQALKDMESEG